MRHTSRLWKNLSLNKDIFSGTGLIRFIQVVTVRDYTFFGELISFLKMMDIYI
jgi:hypothetical protein